MQGMENVNLKMYFHILTLMLFQTHIAFLAWNTEAEFNNILAALFNTKRENEDWKTTKKGTIIVS